LGSPSAGGSAVGGLAASGAAAGTRGSDGLGLALSFAVFLRGDGVLARGGNGSLRERG
jgi:hypothetical protein